MPSILETLEQEEMWYGQDGFPYRVAEMELSHVVNVLAFLRRRAIQLAAQRDWHDLRDAAFTYENGRPIDVHIENSVGDDPAAWLERRPLVKALKYELLLRDTVDGEVVDVRGELT